MNDYRWSIGTLVGFPVLVLATIGLAVLAIWLTKRSKRVQDKVDAAAVWWIGFISALCATGMFIGTAAGMWPYSSEYHQWRETGGVVQSIDSRLLGAGSGGTTERFVVTFDDGRQRSCDDTRCAQVEAGEELVLACKRWWQWAGTHGYDCNYISHKVN